MEQLNLIIPELFLTTSIMILLMIGVFYKNSFNLIFQLSIIILLVTFILIVLFYILDNFYFQIINDYFVGHVYIII